MRKITLRLKRQSGKKDLQQKCISSDVSSLHFWLLWLPQNMKTWLKKKPELTVFVITLQEQLELHGSVDVTQDMLIAEDQLPHYVSVVKSFN